MYFTRSKAHHYSRNFTSVWHHNDIIILGGHMSVREVSRCECCEAYVAETRAPRDMPTRWRFCRSIPSINWRVSGRDRGRLCVWREREREREMMGCFALGGVKSSLLHGIWYASCGWYIGGMSSYTSVSTVSKYRLSNNRTVAWHSLYWHTQSVVNVRPNVFNHRHGKCVNHRHGKCV